MRLRLDPPLGRTYKDLYGHLALMYCLAKWKASATNCNALYDILIN
jgi:hypothetical protein